MSVPFLCCHHHQTLAIPLSAASSASSPYLPPFLPRLHTSVLLTCLPSIPLPFRPSLTPSLHPLARPSALRVSQPVQGRQNELHPLARSAPFGTRPARTARRCSRKRFGNTPARSAPAGTRVGTCVFAQVIGRNTTGAVATRGHPLGTRCKNRSALQPKAFPQHASAVGTRWHPRRHLRFWQQVIGRNTNCTHWRSRHPSAPARHPLQEPHGAAAKSVSATRLRGRHPLAPASAPACFATSPKPECDSAHRPPL